MRQPLFTSLEPGRISQQVRANSALMPHGAELRVSPSEAGYYMDVQEARLRQALPVHTAFLIRDQDLVTVRISGAFMFGDDDSGLSPAAQSTLGTIADILAEFRKTFVVVGSRGGAGADGGYDPALSARRVLAVARFFASHGVPRERIAVVGQGESKPAAEHRRPPAASPTDHAIDITLVSIVAGG